MIVFGVLNAFGRLRISKEGEIEGMDLHEHGISAYPEYVIAPWAAPSGMPLSWSTRPLRIGPPMSTSSVSGRGPACRDLIGRFNLGLIGGSVATVRPTGRQAFFL